MNRDQIKVLFGKAWDDHFPERTPWEKLPEETQNEWIALVEVYERYRDELLIKLLGNV